MMSGTNDQALNDLIAYIKENIPITSHMGVESLHYQDQELSLQVPLSPNKNDKSTAFAGSLSALAMITGWGLTTLLIQDKGWRSDVVIYHNEIHYRKPVAGDFYAVAKLHRKKQLDTFYQSLEAKGKGRLLVDVSIYEKNSDSHSVNCECAYAASITS